jgi:hypothetical protein
VVHSLLANDVRGRLVRKAYVRAANSVSLPALSRYWLIKSRRKIRGSKRRCDCNETFSPHAVIITMSRMVRKREQSFTPHVIAPMICVLSFVLIVVFFLSRMRMRQSLLLLIFFFHFCAVLRSLFISIAHSVYSRIISIFSTAFALFSTAIFLS